MIPKSFQFKSKCIIKGNIDPIADVQPIKNRINKYLILTTTGKVIEMDTNEDELIELLVFESEELNFNERVSLLVSSNVEFIAIYNTYGRCGIVIEISSKEIVMRFNRDDYHFEQTIFPVAFFNYCNQTLLIHGTKWNRLDITNPLNNESLTNRHDPEFELVETKTKNSEHYLDYFHGQLVVSPDDQWVVDNGWEWHPAGCVTGWSIKEWTQNQWESEDGKTRRDLWRGKEDWNDPMFWISNREIGLVGRHNFDLRDEDEPQVQGYLFRTVNVATGEVINEFPIGPGSIYFDTYLFSCSKEIGIKIFDYHSGELQYENGEIIVDNYHVLSKEFIRFNIDQIVTYKLFEEECNFS